MPLLLPRLSSHRGPSSEMLFLAEECAGPLDHKDAGKHVLCLERPPSVEPPLDRVWAHESDDCVDVSGCGKPRDLWGSQGREGLSCGGSCRALGGSLQPFRVAFLLFWRHGRGLRKRVFRASVGGLLYLPLGVNQAPHSLVNGES